MRAFAQKRQEQTTSSVVRPDGTARRAVDRNRLDPLFLQRTIGNQALQRVLRTNVEEIGGGLNGKAIPPGPRSRMEQSFGADLSGVRVNDDRAAVDRANLLNARAFVEGGQIYWGDSAPPLESPAAVPLLAHEISHVVQQRRASSVEDRVSAPGEASEVAANAAARQALAGRAADAGGSFTTASIQRQPKDEGSGALSDKEIEIELIAAYLQKVAKANPQKNLKQLKVVRDALKMLLVDPADAKKNTQQPRRFLDVDQFLDASATPSDPGELAKQFAANLPPIPKAALDRLNSFPIQDAQQSTVERVGDVVKKSKVGGGDANPVPGDVKPQDKAEDINKRLGGGPTHLVDLDIWRLWRIGTGLGGALKPPKKVAPQTDLEAAVTEAIDAVSKDALVPAEAKSKSSGSGEWIEDAQAFAVDLARRMDAAQKGKQEEFSVNLPAAYAGVKDRAATMAAIRAIIEKLRDARSDHASNIKRVIVRVGDSTKIWLVITF